MPEISLKELLDKSLSLSQEEWNELSKESQVKILKLIDPKNIIGDEKKSRKRVMMTEKGREVIRDFIDLDMEELQEMKPHVREKLLLKTTELAQAAGKAA